jgi:transcriptional regulator with XRE-family HTH domain
MTEKDILQLVAVRADARSGEARKTRIAAGLAQSEIAEACGVARPTISGWETGSRTPRGAAALRWAHVLDRLKESRTAA